MSCWQSDARKPQVTIKPPEAGLANRVIDASALLAMLNQEPGDDQLLAQSHGAAISAVNWSKMVQDTRHRGVSPNLAQ